MYNILTKTSLTLVQEALKILKKSLSVIRNCTTQRSAFNSIMVRLSEQNQRFSDVFRWYRNAAVYRKTLKIMGTMARNGL